MDLLALLDRCPLSTSIDAARSEHDPADEDGMAPPLRAVVVIRFSEPGLGFGSVTIRQEGADLFIDSEGMGKDKVKELLGRLVDAAVSDVDTDPARHAAWCAAFKATCGPGCPACGAAAVAAAKERAAGRAG